MYYFTPNVKDEWSKKLNEIKGVYLTNFFKIGEVYKTTDLLFSKQRTLLSALIFSDWYNNIQRPVFSKYRFTIDINYNKNKDDYDYVYKNGFLTNEILVIDTMDNGNFKVVDIVYLPDNVVDGSFSEQIICGMKYKLFNPLKRIYDYLINIILTNDRVGANYRSYYEGPIGIGYFEAYLTSLQQKSIFGNINIDKIYELENKTISTIKKMNGIMRDHKLTLFNKFAAMKDVSFGCFLYKHYPNTVNIDDLLIKTIDDIIDDENEYEYIKKAELGEHITDAISKMKPVKSKTVHTIEKCNTIHDAMAKYIDWRNSPEGIWMCTNNYNKGEGKMYARWKQRELGLI